MVQESKKRSHHRQPHGVPTRHRKPVEEIFEKLDATHPMATASKIKERLGPKNYRNPVGRTALTVFAGGLLLGLAVMLTRKRS